MKPAAFFSILAALFLAPLKPAVHGRRAPDPFAPGDVWCALGDETTHHGDYLALIELFYRTRFPGMSLQVVNAGLHGDTAGSAIGRLAWDVEPHEPTVVSILFGMNDIGRTLYTSGPSSPALEQMRADRIDKFGSDLRSLVARVKSTGARVILLSPTIYDETVQSPAPLNRGANAALARCAQIVRDVANESGAAFIDLHAKMAEANARLQAENPLASIMAANRAEPGPLGHFVAAYAFLRAQNVQGIVSRLVIDLENNVILAADNGVVENVEKSRSSVRFRWTEKALPFPAPEEMRAALKLVPFMEELNQQVLIITGLQPGTWDLYIDKELVGSVTAEQMAAGINLAMTTNTPQYRQAVEIQRLVVRKAELVADGLRSVALVEQRLAPDAERPIDITFMEPLVEDWKSKVGPETLNTPLGRSVSLYLLRKDREAEAAASVRRLTELAELAATPQPHDFELILRR